MTTDDYSHANGIITSPGKFGGEPVYVPHYWTLYLEGVADEDDGEEIRFSLTPEDVALYPELKGYSVLSLSEDGNGFVHSSLI